MCTSILRTWSGSQNGLMSVSKMQHVTFCDSIVRFDWCRTNRIDSVCGVTWIPICARDGSVITWGRGEGETLSHHVVSTQCAVGLIGPLTKRQRTLLTSDWKYIIYVIKKIYETELENLREWKGNLNSCIATGEKGKMRVKIKNIIIIKAKSDYSPKISYYYYWGLPSKPPEED